jgi:hypothetical protein
MNNLAIMESLDWGLFVERYWDRCPVLITGLDSAPFVASEVFQAAVLGTARLPASRVMPPNVQFTIGRDQQVEPGPWLPEQADGSITGYAKRMAVQLAARRYALIVQVLHAFHPPQWKRECTFYSGLWERIGLPSTGAITTLFHGSYEHSPVGVHRDRFATFMHALSGRKRMRFWARQPWPDPVSTVLDYKPYLDSSFTVDIEPGQLLYWPHRYYHVGESDLGNPDHPATSVNVGVRREGHLAEYDLRDLLYDLTPETLAKMEDEPAAPPPDTAGLLAPPDRAGTDLADQLPPDLALALETFRRGFEKKHAHHRSAVRALRTWTGGGFQPAPPPARPRSLTVDDTVRGQAPILWTRTEDAQLCAANGHATTTPVPADRLASLVTELRSGLPLPVAGRTEDERRLLEDLESFRALTRG